MVVSTTSCEEPDETFDNPNLIFPNSLPLRMSPYYYEGQKGLVYVGGDSSTISGITDTLDNRPVFTWEENTAEFLLAAIFNAPVETMGNQIKNTGNVIWRWNTGMEFATNDTVLIKHGKWMSNNVMDTISTPDSLTDGLYYFGVWGWKKDGKQVHVSSREYKFYVKN